MGNKDTVIHSHTVPVAYLANFGINGNEQRESRIYFYNVHENKTNQAKVGKFPVINHFYDINELGEQKQIIEKFFGNKIEGELATLLRVLLGTIIIDPQRRDCSSLQIEKEQLSAQFALLITRTEAFRDYYKDIYQQIKDGFPYADIPQYSKTDFQRIHTSEILDFGMSNFYANLFSDWHWVFIINHTQYILHKRRIMVNLVELPRLILMANICLGLRMELMPEPCSIAMESLALRTYAVY